MVEFIALLSVLCSCFFLNTIFIIEKIKNDRNIFMNKLIGSVLIFIIIFWLVIIVRG